MGFTNFEPKDLCLRPMLIDMSATGDNALPAKNWKQWLGSIRFEETNSFCSCAVIIKSQEGCCALSNLHCTTLAKLRLFNPEWGRRRHAVAMLPTHGAMPVPRGQCHALHAWYPGKWWEERISPQYQNHVSKSNCPSELYLLNCQTHSNRFRYRLIIPILSLGIQSFEAWSRFLFTTLYINTLLKST